MIELKVIGHITADAIGKMVGDKHVSNFAVAVNEKVYKDGQTTERVTFVNCAIWERPDYQKYLLKGTQIYLDGVISVQAFLTKDDKPAYAINLSVRNSELLGTPKN